MHEIIVRFLLGGFVVSLFAVIGDVLRPRTFAGLFGAAPSIALATLGYTIVHQGQAYAAVEARSMILGAAAFVLYAAGVSWVLVRYRTSSLLTTIALMPVWFCFSIGVGLLITRWGWL